MVAIKGGNGEHIPQPQEAGTPFPRCLCSPNKGFNVLSFIYAAQWVWGTYPTHCLWLGGSSSQRNNSWLLARNANIFCCAGCRWEWETSQGMAVRNITGHGRLCSSAQ